MPKKVELTHAQKLAAAKMPWPMDAASRRC